jgi:ElaB/YqjD/DUF883 family membrane-anchored ribosome-binding protein
MAEKSGDINNADNLDPIAVNAGAGSDPFLEKYADDYETSSTESREMMDNTGEHPEETEHLRAQIEETRQQMGETIDRIQERLSFSNVSEQVSEHVSNAIETAKDSIYEATIGKAVTFMRNTGDGIARSNVMRTVRDNPFPLILIGLGAGLLAYQSYSKGNRRGSYRSSNRYLGSGGYGTNWERRDNPGQSSLRETGRSGEGYAGETYNKVTDAAGSAYNSVSNAAGTALDSVSSAATNALQGVTETARNAYSGAGDLVSRAYDTAGDYGSRAYDTYDYYVEENPLAVAAVAAALGAAVGFAIPSSDFEDRLMGESKQNLMQQAQNSAGDLIKRAKQVADEAGHTLKDEANRALNQ